MKIFYYMPFKPLGHPNPSGDLIIGSGLFAYLRRCGHEITLASTLRARWLYWKPWMWLHLLKEAARIVWRLRKAPVDIWLTYHSYYKAPDALGALCTLIRPTPYFIFQGVYSTKRRRHWKTRPGFMINRWVLGQAVAVFTNKRRDEINLKRLLPTERVHYIAPGVDTALFRRDAAARKALRREWGEEDAPVILTAAMFRPGVKTEGLEKTIRACQALRRQGLDFRLVVCGDGASGPHLRALARRVLGANAVFTGKIPREAMYRFFSAADIFAFPGIHEGLGMVYLEAQACGLPVVAFDRWGASELVRDGQTGLLCSSARPQAFQEALAQLIQDGRLRRRLGAAAREHVCAHHDQDRNHRHFEHLLRTQAEFRS
ncbi:MAG: glycosyltransferase family 4 protein [Desulfobacterales bacterium]|nr:glycosyltransferase family 4 protein [Desulfobacterales bacterium]